MANPLIEKLVREVSNLSTKKEREDKKNYLEETLEEYKKPTGGQYSSWAHEYYSILPDVIRGLEESISKEEEQELLLDWVSKNYTPDNGVGYWLPIFDVDAEPITTKDLLKEWREGKYNG